MMYEKAAAAVPALESVPTDIAYLLIERHFLVQMQCLMGQGRIGCLYFPPAHIIHPCQILVHLFASVTAADLRATLLLIGDQNWGQQQEAEAPTWVHSRQGTCTSIVHTEKSPAPHPQYGNHPPLHFGSPSHLCGRLPGSHLHE